MTQRELLEQALLDALSMLEGEEREEFERAFAAAPPHVQAQIRREQTRFVRNESLLPEVTPPASLRARVLDAVRRAMAAEPAEAAPATLRLADPDEISRLPAVAHRRKVAAVWRALALGSAAAAVVLGVTTMHLQDVVKRLDADRDPLVEVLKREFGPEHFVKALVDDSTSRVSMVSAGEGDSAQAAIWYNPDWNTARLFGINLPASQNDQYSLVVLDSEGNTVQTVAEFTFDGGNGLLNHAFPITVALQSEHLAIVGRDGDNADRMLVGTPAATQIH